LGSKRIPLFFCSCKTEASAIAAPNPRFVLFSPVVCPAPAPLLSSLLLWTGNLKSIAIGAGVALDFFGIVVVLAPAMLLGSIRVSGFEGLPAILALAAASFFEVGCA
jgi:hypothetical protein